MTSATPSDSPSRHDSLSGVRKGLCSSRSAALVLWCLSFCGIAPSKGGIPNGQSRAHSPSGTTASMPVTPAALGNSAARTAGSSCAVLALAGSAPAVTSQ